MIRTLPTTAPWPPAPTHTRPGSSPNVDLLNGKVLASVATSLRPGASAPPESAAVFTPLSASVGSRYAPASIGLMPAPSLMQPSGATPPAVPRALRLPNPVQVRVLLLARPDDDRHFDLPSAAGHPDNLRSLQAVGASVQVLRASCLCQGHRLVSKGQVDELLQDGTSMRFHRAPGSPSDAATLARCLGHLRCLVDGVCDSAFSSRVDAMPAVLVILEASARLARGGSTWLSLLEAASGLVARGEEMLLLTDVTATGGRGLASAYALSSLGCQALLQQRSSLQCAVADADGALAALAGLQSPTLSSANSTLLHNLGGRAAAGVVPLFLPDLNFADGPPAMSGKANGLSPSPSPSLRVAPPNGRSKVVIISLPHRGDRRAEPLVGSEAAVRSMRDAGFDVEIMRASCYCERDRLNLRSSLNLFVDGTEFEWLRYRRYEGAELPMDSAEAERLRAAIEDHYEEGADRLVDPGDGGMETYVVHSNWPGATSCAISHLRALISAAVGGYEHVLVFEDDAVISASVARARGWCEGSCRGELCLCAGAWASCVEESFELMRRTPSMDVLYLGLGEVFEGPEKVDGLLEGEGSSSWLGFLMGRGSAGDGDDLGGVTRIGYTWCAHAMGYSRSALDDTITLRLWELVWAQDETIPHLYCRKPWNHRFVNALRNAGWRRRWVAGAPSDCFSGLFGSANSEGWVMQLEGVEDLSVLDVGTAALSSNSQEF
eukprot:TRINITY_DN54944_c0_g1_i1.p1 TRINITY_DN54944_c0_g1~~TRINITY_DN54944_c0_g1_i1.p1  ORF type:complete len:720 (-),score=85.12 TRINITY_DN54944_c0_g1_i1:66-2225(-)